MSPDEFALVVRRANPTELESTPDVRALVSSPCFGNGQYALHYSTLQNDIGMVRTLVQLGADINAQDANAFTPVFIAASSTVYIDLLEFFVSCPTFSLRSTSNVLMYNICRNGGYHGDDVKGAVSFCTYCTLHTTYLASNLAMLEHAHSDPHFVPCVGVYSYKRLRPATAIIRHHGEDVASRIVPQLNTEALCDMLRAAVRDGKLEIVKAIANYDVLNIYDPRNEHPILIEAIICAAFHVAEYMILHTNVDIHATDRWHESPLDFSDYRSRDGRKQPVPFHLIDEMTRRRVYFSPGVFMHVFEHSDLRVLHAYARSIVCKPRDQFSVQDTSSNMFLRGTHDSRRDMIANTYTRSPQYICTVRRLRGDDTISIQLLHDMLLRGAMPIPSCMCANAHCHVIDTADECDLDLSLYGVTCPYSLPRVCLPNHVTGRPPLPLLQSVLLRLACQPWTPARHAYMYSSYFHEFVKSVMIVFACISHVVVAVPDEMVFTVVSFISRDWFPVHKVGADVVRSDDPRMEAWRAARDIDC